MAQNENSKLNYRWVRTSLPELVFRFGSEWQIGLIDASDGDLLWLVGSAATWAIEQWDIGPEINESTAIAEYVRLTQGEFRNRVLSPEFAASVDVAIPGGPVPIAQRTSDDVKIAEYLDKVFTEAGEEFDRVMRFGTEGVAGTPRINPINDYDMYRKVSK